MTTAHASSRDFPRRLEPELMDDPALDGAEHHAALRGLARLNRVSRSSALLERGIHRVLGASTSADLLDVATGSGDLLIDLASRHTGRLRLRGCDISGRALEAARARASSRDLAIEFFEADAIRGGPLPECDIAMCSLFLHHLDRDDATTLLARMRDSARLGVVAVDMRRTRAGLALAYLASRLLTRSRVVHTDAVRSARAAWTIEEARTLFEAAGMAGASIDDAWPSRFLATWRRADG